ncbi:LytR/AlgR family response regulator transcription factor [Flavihumibacter fluvii]|uniref:LytR/AlgR family response regulator transcription factor n=1 Tax=Flavihumibacter fluvii TaxID=2838157 RepID=UPI001BDE6578|nr:LytTR family DNA-binding domain-containing protein [Flavihumibacter fluvii]ULQ51390.1 LytTR family DNA-binding domain-containing protein [Flavihumibacter fluvii]
MRALIIEDEQPAVDRLQVLIKQVCPDTLIDACLDSVSDSVDWFRNHTHPDVVFMDIHLSDGSAFDIFRKVTLEVPVIFTTAFDQYALDAFSVMGIDYLLKPVSAGSLDKAITKMNRLKNTGNDGIDYKKLLSALNTNGNQYKSRFLVKIGSRSFFVEAADVAYFQADNKIVYLIAMDGCRYIIDHTLESLEQVLDPGKYFRPNRSMIVQSSAIQQIKPYINGRLKLTVKVAGSHVELLVSRERVNAFRVWAEQ